MLFKKLITLVLICISFEAMSQTVIRRDVVEADDNFIPALNLIKAPKKLGELRRVIVGPDVFIYKCKALTGTEAEMWERIDAVSTITYDMPSTYIIDLGSGNYQVNVAGYVAFYNGVSFRRLEDSLSTAVEGLGSVEIQDIIIPTGVTLEIITTLITDNATDGETAIAVRRGIFENRSGTIIQIGSTQTIYTDITEAATANVPTLTINNVPSEKRVEIGTVPGTGNKLRSFKVITELKSKANYTGS